MQTLGGWHLFQLNDERLNWTAGKMREYGVQHFLGAHCTGVEAVYRIRQLNRMRRDRCVVGGVGATFDLNAVFLRADRPEQSEPLGKLQAMFINVKVREGLFAINFG